MRCKLIIFILFKYCVLYVLRSGIPVTESLHEAIQQYNILESVQDTVFKQWLSTVSISPSGQKVKAPNGLINTLIKISSHGPIGIILYKSF